MVHASRGVEFLRKQFNDRHKEFVRQREMEKQFVCKKIGEKVFNIVEKIAAATLRSNQNIELIRAKKNGMQGRYDMEKQKLVTLLQENNP